MTSIGDTLRRERQRRNIDLPEIAGKLKISTRFLEAIEHDDFGKLPGGVFTKSFVRQYADLLGLDADEILLLQDIPYRGSLPAMPPTDPLIYRFYELVQVYGTTWKSLIQEEFGDGIMSAIDFDMKLERQPDQKGDRVRVSMTGKFLPYKQY